MNEVEASRRAARRALAQTQVSVAEAGRFDLLPAVHALRERYRAAPRTVRDLEAVRAAAQQLAAQLWFAQPLPAETG